MSVFVCSIQFLKTMFAALHLLSVTNFANLNMLIFPDIHQELILRLIHLCSWSTVECGNPERNFLLFKHAFLLDPHRNKKARLLLIFSPDML